MLLTLPICPICDGKKGYWIDDPKSNKFHDLEVKKWKDCETCNGNGKITVHQLECVARQLKNDLFEMECKLKNGSGKT